MKLTVDMADQPTVPSQQEDDREEKACTQQSAVNV